MLLPPQWFLSGTSGRGPVSCPPHLPTSHQPAGYSVLTWQSQQGEVAPALREARTLSNTGAPQPLVVEYSCHWVVVQVLGTPLVHAGGGNDARNPNQRDHEAQALAGGHGHGGAQRSQSTTQRNSPALRVLRAGVEFSWRGWDTRHEWAMQ